MRLVEEGEDRRLEDEERVDLRKLSGDLLRAAHEVYLPEHHRIACAALADAFAAYIKRMGI